jgi:hypothetical protein
MRALLWVAVGLGLMIAACESPRARVVIAPLPSVSDAGISVPHPQRSTFSVASPGWTSGGAMDADAIYVGNETGIFAYARADGAMRVVTQAPASIHALASDGDALYWFSEQNVMRVQKSGGEPTVVAADQRAHGDPIVADAEHLYWACWGVMSSSGMGLWVGSREAAPRRISELGQIDPNEVRELAIDEGRVYIGLKARGAAVLVVAASGGTPAPLDDTTTGFGVVDAFAFDTERVYWIDNERKKVFSSDKHGGKKRELANVTDFANSMAVAGGYVYWADWGQLEKEINGTVQRVPKTGGKTETLVTAPEQAAWVAADGGFLYWFGRRVVEARRLL